MTDADVAEAVRQWCAAWDARDVARILAMEAEQVGFGFRTAEARNPPVAPEAQRRAALERFFAPMLHYRLELEWYRTSVAAGVGLAWGVYVEEFQRAGHSRERAQVRFSKVLVPAVGGWRILLFHRDIQPFDADGAYPRALTAGDRAS
jgi:ketosteroid isomerase-like protein